MPPSLRDQLQAALGSAYRLDRELAGGGMSRVFVATEIALGRPVVVKVLHPELAADVTAERFAREIQLAARLQQANIVPLLTAGHTGTLPFYTMPFVDGLSLRQRIGESGKLGIAETVGILRDVARALAYAHDAGVVHRGIKPENVLISGGAAVVTDFGIAKAISVARTGPAAATITQAGVGIGTPAYMAPEQASGDPTMDHRADIYSFGCLAYELLTGQPPFRSNVPHELFAAHMTERPTPVAAVRNDVPVGLAQLVARCLEKDPALRPQGARELLGALEAVATPSAVRLSSSSGVGRRLMVAIAVVVVVVGITYGLVNRRGVAAAAADPSLAVIPFLNVGGDSAQDYLADGVSDEVATAIGKVPGVRLASRSGAYRYRGRRDIDVRDVGKALSVRFVVQGTVRRLGEQLRISAQLNDASNGTEVWSENFDRTTKDVFRTQDEIASAVTNALASRVRGGATAPAARRANSGQGTHDVEAYDLYLRGEFFLRRRQINPAAEMFRRAIARDTGFARAYVGLSQTLALAPYYTATPNDSVSGEISRVAQQALVRDSTLAETQMAIALMHLHSWHWDEARAAFERAVAADPSDVQTHFQFGRYYFYLGADSAALAEWSRAKQIDPFSALAAAWTAQLLTFQGKLPEAVAEIRRAIEYDSSAGAIKQMASRVYQFSGDRARQLAFADRMPNIPPWNGMTAYHHAITGDRAGAMTIVQGLEAKPASLWFRNTALMFAYLGLGDTTRALAALERASEHHEMWATFNRVSDPLFDPIRGNARWATLVRRAGLGGAPGAIR